MKIDEVFTFLVVFAKNIQSDPNFESQPIKPSISKFPFARREEFLNPCHKREWASRTLSVIFVVDIILSDNLETCWPLAHAHAQIERKKNTQARGPYKLKHKKPKN